MRDREVVASIVAGDPTGLAAAYDKYADALYGYARSFLREPADAADVVHDTFVIAAASLSQLRDPERLRPWLYAVARSLCLRRLRATKAAAIYVAPEDIPEDIGEDVDAVSETERAELRALLRAAGGGLNPGERDIVELRLWQGLDAAEAAAALGITRGYAHALLSRGRDQLTASVAALLVARTGRGDCAELDQILSGWDGQLTVLMRKRLSRHIERCDICSDRRRRELRPALLALWPIGALSGAALAERALHAASVPTELRAEVLRATSGTNVHAAASTAGLGSQVRMGGQNGFPKPGAAPRPLTLSRAVLRRGGGHSHVTLWSAAGAAAVLVGTGVFLSTYFLGHPGKSTAAAAGLARPVTSSGPGATGPGSPGGRRGPGSGGSGAPGASGGSGGSAGRGGSGGRVVPVVTLKRGPGTSPAPGSSTGSTAPSAGGSSSGAGGAPSSSAPSTSAPVSGPVSTAPSTAPASSAPTPSPTSAPTSSSPPPSTAAGTLSVSPTSVVLTPLLGSTLTLTAENGPVSWSISEPASLLGELNVSPSSGTLAAGQSVQVTISVSGLASLDTTLTVNPGGQAVTVLLGLGL
jgi:RNA polymerase sigma factor (sigma-70 family)